LVIIKIVNHQKEKTMSSKKRFAVVLSGNGVFDGAEIHESVMTLYAIDKNNCEYQVFAPDIEQHHVLNHLTGEEMDEKRNVLIESARIARGNAKALSEYSPKDFDALIFPGGFGAAKNLSSFAFDGANCTVNREVEEAVRETHKAGKVIGALCIAPVILAKVLGEVVLTVGQDEGTTAALEQMGAKTVKTNAREIAVDKSNKIVSNPCYMLNSSITDIAEGANNVVRAMIELM
jgi:enhancing lycopene biosynthesis protein 2